MSYSEIISRVADSLGLSKELVDKTYKAYWRAIKEHIEQLPLENGLTDEEFLQLQTSINIPSLGKLHVTLDRYHKSDFVSDKAYNKDNKYKKQDNNVEN